ncbi:APC family permease [Albimonas pacifica]|uniref:Amino acid/polyamine/organocation transporter, APC superfamily n=1 Tax=Albimonas pacifica TaxID=1114924 RepID=A0A1I3CU05_9RHOB|nr:APC family permease [Albimonas pacifica]SFH77759.1 amino acid/polyamine/organocation transporter, APC superfamily [Albimonas pacifica]
MTDASSAPGLQRRLGFWLLMLYGLGVMVGAGIYVLIGEVGGRTGLLAPAAFLLAALVAAPTAMSYAELAGRIPEAGGEVAWLRDAFGLSLLPPVAGLLIVGGATLSAAAVIQGGAAYLWALTPLPADLKALIPYTWLIPPLIAAMAVAAVWGVVESMVVAAVLTLVEVSGLLLAIWAGFEAPPTAEWRDGLPGAVEHLGGLGGAASALAGASLLAFFAFIGFEDMVNMAEETHDPGRTMARAILAALAITAVLYALVAAAALHALPSALMATMYDPLTGVVRAGAPALVPVIALIGGAAALNGVLAQMVMGARILYGTGRRHPRLALLARVAPGRGTPWVATLLMGALVTGVALLVPLGPLAAGSAGVLLAVFVGVNLALVVLRRKAPAPDGAWTAPFWAPWAGMALSAAAVAAGVFGG